MFIVLAGGASEALRSVVNHINLFNIIALLLYYILIITYIINKIVIYP